MIHNVLYSLKIYPVVIVTSLTLTVVSLVDFLLDSLLEGLCFLSYSKVQSNLTVLRCGRISDTM